MPIESAPADGNESTCRRVAGALKLGDFAVEPLLEDKVESAFGALQTKRAAANI